VERALSEWEPRITSRSVTVDPDPDDREAAIVTITYRLVATARSSVRA
jgi:phage baseplate assembly protein W